MWSASLKVEKTPAKVTPAALSFASTEIMNQFLLDSLHGVQDALDQAYLEFTPMSSIMKIGSLMLLMALFLPMEKKLSPEISLVRNLVNFPVISLEKNRENSPVISPVRNRENSPVISLEKSLEITQDRIRN